jgi:hypothetical protein
MRRSMRIEPSSTATVHFPRRSSRSLRRLVQALGVATLVCVTMSSTNARYDGPTVGTQPASQESPLVELPTAPPIVIESAPNPDPTQDQLMQTFRDALGQPSNSSPSERRLSDGTVEVITRFAHLCAKPPLGRLESGLGGEITLAAPCAVF